jgi:hypothetical protein
VVRQVERKLATFVTVIHCYRPVSKCFGKLYSKLSKTSDAYDSYSIARLDLGTKLSQRAPYCRLLMMLAMALLAI